MKEYINECLEDWFYQSHIFEKVSHMVFLEDNPIVLKKTADTDYLQSPLFRQVLSLCETVRDAGTLKLTAIGNLPLKVVHQNYKLGVLDKYFEKNISRIRKESDSITVHTARLVAEMGGLIKKQKKSLVITSKGLRCIKYYPLLMESILATYGQKLSWAYFDGYKNPQIGQYGFGLSILLLAKFGDKERDSKFYSERYFYHNQRLEREEGAYRCYSLRTFVRFLFFLGLVNIKQENQYTPNESLTILKSDLFDKIIGINKDFGKIEYSAESGIPLFLIRIELCKTTPAIWREFIIPSNLKLRDLHVVIQAVMGWTDSHLHEFIKDGKCYTVRYATNDYWEELECTDYKELKICDFLSVKGDTIHYLYDFGDYWMHSLKLAEVIESSAFNSSCSVECLKGEGHCPPEDCGGIHGFYDMLEILKDPSHEEHKRYLTWLGEKYYPDQFDLHSVNKKLNRFLIASLG